MFNKIHSLYNVYDITIYRMILLQNRAKYILINRKYICIYLQRLSDFTSRKQNHKEFSSWQFMQAVLKFKIYMTAQFLKTDEGIV